MATTAEPALSMMPLLDALSWPQHQHQHQREDEGECETDEYSHRIEWDANAPWIVDDSKVSPPAAVTVPSPSPSPASPPLLHLPPTTATAFEGKSYRPPLPKGPKPKSPRYLSDIQFKLDPSPKLTFTPPEPASHSTPMALKVSTASIVNLDPSSKVVPLTVGEMTDRVNTLNLQEEQRKVIEFLGRKLSYRRRPINSTRSTNSSCVML